MNTSLATHPGEIQELLKFAYEEELCHRVADISYNEEMDKLAQDFSSSLQKEAAEGEDIANPKLWARWRSAGEEIEDKGDEIENLMIKKFGNDPEKNMQRIEPYIARFEAIGDENIKLQDKIKGPYLTKEQSAPYYKRIDDPKNQMFDVGDTVKEDLGLGENLEKAVDKVDKVDIKPGRFSSVMSHLKGHKGKYGLGAGALAALGGGAYALSRRGGSAKAALLEEYLYG